MPDYRRAWHLAGTYFFTVNLLQRQGNDLLTRHYLARTLSEVLCLGRHGRMKPLISVITLGVEDLNRAVQFYRDGLGLMTEGEIGKEYEYGAVAFFDLQPGLKLALWPRKSIARDSGLPPGAPRATEFTLGHNVASKDEVDAVMNQAENAGAIVVKPAQATFWGGYTQRGIYGKWYGTLSFYPTIKS